MWYLNQIPKILHIYWGGDLLPYLRFLTVKSFMELNPDWDILLWTPKESYQNITWVSGEHNFKIKCTNYLPELLRLKINKEIVDFASLGFNTNTSEVHKNDYIRINALRLYGGLWADMDIIFFKSVNELYFNNLKFKNKEIFVCKDSFTHSTGFLMATSESVFYDKLSDLISKEFKSSHYQCLGPSLFNKYFPTIESINKISSAFNISMEVVYAHDSNQVNELIKNGEPRFTDKSIGCHWYGAHKVWGDYLNQTNGGLIKMNNIINDVMDSGR
jgi:hypothetical protein